VEARATARTRWTRSRLCALLLVAGSVVHAGALGGIFVFDDILAIVENPHTRSLWPPWYAAWAEHESPLAGRPIPAFSLAVNHALGGLAPAGYKAANLALHLLCGLALFATVGSALRGPVLATRFGSRADSLAFASALLWLVHPLASECVVYVTQRTESWMALAYLGALACTARAWDGDRARQWRRRAVLCCAAGMASKEVMVSAPLVIVAFDWAYGGGSFRALLRERARFYAALAACWLVLVGLMLASFRSDTVGFDEGTSAATYLWNQAWVIPRYLRLVVWPSGLALDWGVPRSVSFADVWPGFMSLAALLVVAIGMLWRRPALGWPLVCVFAVLAPTSSFVPIVTEAGAERRMFLPLAALLALGVVASAEAARHLGLGARVQLAAVVGAAALLAAVTVQHAALFADRLAVWQSAAAAFPDNARAHTNVGQALIELGRFDDAVPPLRRAVEIAPDYADGHNELAIGLAAVGLRSEARAHFERAVELEPQLARPLRNLGMLLAEAGERERAKELLRRALQLEPASAKAARTLAWLIATEGEASRRRSRRAIALAERALALDGENATGLDVLAAAHAAAGDFERAIELAVGAQQLARAEGRLGLRAAIGARLEHYRRGESWSEP
jgi:Flp pilus assembly protein TadD